MTRDWRRTGNGDLLQPDKDGEKKRKESDSAL
jgi:hypothetical protein